MVSPCGTWSGRRPDGGPGSGTPTLMVGQAGRGRGVRMEPSGGSRVGRGLAVSGVVDTVPSDCYSRLRSTGDGKR